MPALNKQTLVNLLIDSPLREPIKINLIDIVNNTNDADLPKTYSTIAKELEIFQKATERRMKLADETIAKLKEDGGTAPGATTPASASDTSLPPLPPLPPLPTPPVAPEESQSTDSTTSPATTPDVGGLSVPNLDLPPLPKLNQQPTPEVSDVPATPAPTTPAADSPAPATADADEDALKEIQKELDALKTSAAEEAAPAITPAPPQA